MRQQTHLWGTEDIARRWQALAERRREHFADLHHSGRWRKYYREHSFQRQMNETARMTDAWSRVVHGHGTLSATSSGAARSISGSGRF
ncbi:MAG: TIGR03809 family protein [Xanthobacteraceae bacterium]